MKLHILKLILLTASLVISDAALSRAYDDQYRLIIFNNGELDYSIAMFMRSDAGFLSQEWFEIPRGEDKELPLEHSTNYLAFWLTNNRGESGFVNVLSQFWDDEGVKRLVTKPSNLIKCITQERGKATYALQYNCKNNQIAAPFSQVIRGRVMHGDERTVTHKIKYGFEKDEKLITDYKAWEENQTKLIDVITAKDKANFEIIKTFTKNLHRTYMDMACSSLKRSNIFCTAYKNNTSIFAKRQINYSKEELKDRAEWKKGGFPLEKSKIKLFSEIIKDHDVAQRAIKDPLDKLYGLNVLLDKKARIIECYYKTEYGSSPKYYFMMDETYNLTDEVGYFIIRNYGIINYDMDTCLPRSKVPQDIYYRVRERYETPVMARAKERQKHEYLIKKQEGRTSINQRIHRSRTIQPVEIPAISQIPDSTIPTESPSILQPPQPTQLKDTKTSQSTSDESIKYGRIISNEASVRTSSTSRKELPGSPVSLIDNDSDVRFAFHTKKEKNPWVEIDLGNEFGVTAVTIINRNKHQKRAASLRMLVSLNGEQWDEVWRATNIETKWEVMLSNTKARYIRLQNGSPKNTWLHLKNVTVFGELL